MITNKIVIHLCHAENKTRQQTDLSCDASLTWASSDLMGNSRALELERPMWTELGLFTSGLINH